MCTTKQVTNTEEGSMSVCCICGEQLRGATIELAPGKCHWNCCFSKPVAGFSDRGVVADRRKMAIYIKFWEAILELKLKEGGNSERR